jgi:ribonuclease Z
VYLTHFHGAHLFGLPALLTKWCVVGRERPLQVIGQFGTETRVKELLDLAYPSIRQRLPFPLTFTESESEARFGELVLQFAQTDHPQKNFAVRIEHGNHAIGISGDGRITPASQELLRECDIVVHDGFTFERKTPVHATACEVVEALSGSPRLQTVAFVHLQRSERAQRLTDYLTLEERFPAGSTPRPTVLCPQPGDILDIR